MKALVKARPEPGLWLEDVPKPAPGDRDVLDPGSQDIDLRHRSAHPSLGCLGAVDDPRSDGRRPRVHGRDRTGRRRCGRPRSRPTGGRRRPHHLRTLSQLQRWPPRVLPQPHRRRCHPAGRVRRVRRDPRTERLRRPRAHRRQRRRRARSAGQRHPHRIAIRRRRRGRADHRRRADRHPGHGDRAPHRRSQRGRHRHQPLPPRHGGQARRQPRRRRAHRAARPGDDRARDDRRIRCRAGDVGRRSRRSTRCSTR